MDFGSIVPALPGLWDGMAMTLQLTGLGVLGGVVLGTLLALMRLSHNRLLSNLAGFYVNYFRSIPLLLVITWFYLAVPYILRWITGSDTPVGAFTSCLVAFVMFEAAYFCEIVRAGIQAIHQGQIEAAESLGMRGAMVMRRVVLPQAFRIALPPYGNTLVMMLKDSSLVSTITVAEMTRAGQLIASSTFENMTVYTLVALLYLAMSLPLSFALRRLEARIGRRSKR